MIIHWIWDDSLLAFDHHQPRICCVPCRMRSCNGFAMYLACLRGFFPSRCNRGCRGRRWGARLSPCCRDGMVCMARCGVAVLMWSDGSWGQPQEEGGKTCFQSPLVWTCHFTFAGCNNHGNEASYTENERGSRSNIKWCSSCLHCSPSTRSHWSTEHLWLGCWKPLGIAGVVFLLLLLNLFVCFVFYCSI